MATSTFKGILNHTDSNPLKDPCLRMNLFWTFCLTLSAVFVGYDSALFNSLQALPSFFEEFPDLATDSNLLGIVGAVYSLAGIYTPFFAGWLADKYGRKVPIIAGMVGLCFSPAVMASAKSLGILILGRWLLGTSTFLCMNICVALLVEIAHPRFRPIAAAVYLCGYYLGSIICSLVTLGTYLHFPDSPWSWKTPTLVQIALPIILLPAYAMMPGSPRWLVAQGRIEDAKALFAKIHANGHLDDPLVAFELQETVEAITAEKKASRFSALFKSKANRWRAGILLTVGAGSSFTGSSVVTYYFTSVLQSVGITSYTNILLISAGLNASDRLTPGISNLLFALLGALMVERLGRRGLWLTSTGSMLVFMTIVTALSATFVKTGSAAVGGATVAFLFLFFAGYDIGFTSLAYAYAAEILPYTLRTTGLAFQNAAGCIGLFFSLWVNPIALTHIGWKYYLVFIACLVLIFTIQWFYFPETKGLTLEEVAIRFEGAEGDLSGLDPGVIRVQYQEDKVEKDHVEDPEKIDVGFVPASAEA